MAAIKTFLFQLGLMFEKYRHFRLYYWKSSIFEIIVPILVVGYLCYIAGEVATYKIYLSSEELRGYDDHRSHKNKSRSGKIQQDQNKLSERIRRHLSVNDTEGDEEEEDIDRRPVFVLFTPNTYGTQKFSQEVEGITLDVQKNFNFTFHPAETLNKLLKLMDENSYPRTDNFSQVIGLNYQNSIPDDYHPLMSVVHNEFAYTFVTKNQEMNQLYVPVLYESEEMAYPQSAYLRKGYVSLQLSIDYVILLQRTETALTFLQTVNNTVKPLPHPAGHTFVTRGRIMIIKSLKYLIVMILIFQAGPLIAAIIAEKDTGVKELMKVYGITESLVWISWFLNTLIFSIILCTIITIMVQIGWAGEATSVLQQTHAMVFWCFVNLVMIANILVAFIVAAVFQKTAYATISFILFTVVLTMVADFSNNREILFITMFVPSGALVHGFKRIERYEASTEYLTFERLSETENLTKEFSMSLVFKLLAVQDIPFVLFTFYTSKINPGPYGIKKSPFFIFGLDLIRRTRKSRILTEQLTASDETENPYIEEVPKYLQPSIVIKNVHKKYGSIHAVVDTNLIIYKNEITALLGPNGAGKTTLIAMLTGFTNATSGSIIYDEEIDVLENSKEFRKNVSFCPQENRLFPYMSVKHHLIFFARLRGATTQEATIEMEKFVKYAGLQGKEEEYVNKLSGGMKRKLCLGIALVGKSEVIILDEPTAGVDVQSRRKLWNLLLYLRNKRTIILTTHHLEEADVLGDRIAIMVNGTVKTHGTSMFLKHVFESGYRVTVTKNDDPRTSEKLIELIENEIPNAKIGQSRSPTEINFILPLKDIENYPAYFKVLEANSINLNVIRIGVGYTTLEDVFIKVSEHFDSDNDTRTTSSESFTYTDIEKLRGISLIFQQYRFLIYKKIIHTMRNGYTIFFQILFPTLLMCIAFYSMREAAIADTEILFTMETYYPGGVFATIESLIKTKLGNKFKKYIGSHKGHSLVFEDFHARKKFAEEHYLKYKYDTIIGSKMIEDEARFEFNSLAVYSIAILLNAYSNAVLQSETGNNSFSITTKLKILKELNVAEASRKQVKMDLTIWCFAIGFFTMDLGSYFSTLVIYERIEGFKHIQELSDVSSLVHWSSHFIMDITIFIIIIVIRWLLFYMTSSTKFLKFSTNLSDMNDVFAIFVLSTLIFVYAALMFTYATSFLAKAPGTYYVKCTSLNAIGSFLVMVVILFDYTIGRKQKEYADFEESSSGRAIALVLLPVRWIYHIYPPLTYFALIVKMSITWFHNTVEHYHYPYFGGRPSDRSPLSLNREFLWLCISSVVYTILLFIMELKILGKLMNICLESNRYRRILKSKRTLLEDVNVVNERLTVAANFEKPNPELGFILMVKSLKKFHFSFAEPSLAVKNLAFAVRAAECFGLLGLNGAGKSTSFKMLVGETIPSDGDASVTDYKLSVNRRQYLSEIGYSAQTNIFIEQLNGRQMLTLCAALKGIPRKGIKKMVNDWLTIIGLEKFENRPCGTYSGGNKRKLCTAMCLIGNPKVIFLDEPTAGVDAVSKQKLYSVMQLSRDKGQAIVLTSHSLEECELLCDRLTIMAYGEMKCIGSAQELKHQFAQGFAVQIKIGQLPKKHLKRFQQLTKKEMNRVFEKKVELVDEHEGLLQFQVTNTSLRWSQLFSRMEYLKAKYSSIEEYVITDTTLEQVFLSFSE